MIHQTLSLEKYWKLFPATLTGKQQISDLWLVKTELSYRVRKVWYIELSLGKGTALSSLPIYMNGTDFESNGEFDRT